MMTTAGAKLAFKPALMQAKSVSVRYTQRAPFSGKKITVDALKDVDFAILPQSWTAIVGESGSGKSTLAACLAALQKPDKGQVWFKGREVTDWNTRELAWLRPRIQLVFQDSAGALNPQFTAAQIIAEPLEIQKRARGKDLRDRACMLLEEVGLSADWADRTPLQWSGGQRQRLAIARALALQPDLLILDESLSGLDLITQAQILNLLIQLQTQHSFTYLLISHDLSLVAQVADYVAVMHEGCIVEQGSRENVFGRPQHVCTHELVDAALSLESGFHDLQVERSL